MEELARRIFDSLIIRATPLDPMPVRRGVGGKFESQECPMCPEGFLLLYDLYGGSSWMCDCCMFSVLQGHRFNA